MHFFIIAGEASGDLHASHLIAALRSENPNARFTFLGGDLMADAADAAPLVHYKDMAYMGFSQVIKNLGKVRKNLSIARNAIKEHHPDALILVDYPSFNLKMAAFAKKIGIPVFYYISPKVWAWKKWRIADIRRYVNSVLAIFPFEPDFYRKNNYDNAIYVGNPSVEEVDADIAAADPREIFLKKYALRDRPLVALMPGSRQSEIHNNLPVMNLAMAQFPQYRGVIIGAPNINDEVYAEYGAGNIPVIRPKNAAEALVHCRAALVTSGTATLETALVGIPQVAMYRSNGSKLSYDIMSRILSVPFVTLPNLIAGKQIIPEMLLHMCTPQLIADTLAPILRLDSPLRNSQIEGYALMRSILGKNNAAATAAKIITNSIPSAS